MGISPLVRHWGEGRPTRRRRPPRWLWLGLVVVAVVVAGVAIWLGTRSHPWHPPSRAWQFTSCTYGGYVSGRCGTIAVPEDPSKPEGRTVNVQVTVLPSTMRPAAGALFYLEGGPGGAATQAAVRVNQLFAEISRYRDIVMVDQRGTGGSARLACPDQPVRADEAGALTAYLRDCFAHLHGDPRLDTTSVAADDLDAVRRTLGYRKIDLYGGSYGATLAEAYLRAYPGSVRSVVLDSGSLPNVRVYDVSARNAEHALDLQLGRCARAPSCHRAYPNTRHELDVLLSRRPHRAMLVSGPVIMQPDDVARTISTLSASPDGAATIPYVIHAAVRGDYTALALAFHDDLGADLDARSRQAMFWVILCSEPWAAFDVSATARDGAGSYLEHAAVARAQVFRQACGVVPKGVVPAGSSSPGVSHAPVLLLAGGADPLDPIANLRGWRQAFPNGRLVVVPAGGHGAIDDPCVQAIVARFVAAASVDLLNTACARHISPPAFETG